MKNALLILSLATIGSQSMVAMNQMSEDQRAREIENRRFYGSPEEQEQMRQRHQETNEGYARQALNRNQNLYAIIGVNSNATAKEIGSAYRRRALQIKQQDRNWGSSSAMKQLNHAWDILKDPAARAAYDRTGIAPMQID